MALLGLAILHEDEKKPEKDNNISDDDDQNGTNVEQVVESVTQAIAPILLPMIDGLGTLEATDMETYSGSGESD